MHSHDNDASIRPTPRTHLGWHKPKRVLVGSLIYNDETPQRGDPIIPCIKLRGMWMCEAGIAPGTRLTVEVYDGAILLRAAEPAVSVQLRPVRRTHRRIYSGR
ncbi:SymE family type I addiction module toxin [Stenotrophomonas sp. 22385]|uniref:SymE family type I addiction module toxin n=1 Tax=Stenotrophomonas sp. 22385 TaxID=3453915 RepID=UPI003F85A5A8